MRIHILLLLSLFLITASCSEYHKVMKGNDMEAKYNLGVKYFEKKDYYRALQLFEEIINIYKGTTKAEQASYYYSLCTYNVDDYQMAAYQLNSFINTYPASVHNEELQFLYAYCFYKDSPKSNLDQTNTYEAIEKFQLFINRYPSSVRVEEANKLIDELRFKLETKAFNNAKLYVHTENYKAAIVALNNVIKDYPATIFKEECLFLTFKSAYIYAENSVAAKKGERFRDAREHYFRLVDNFPQSKYLREAEKMFDDVKQALESENQSAVSN